MLFEGEKIAFVMNKWKLCGVISLKGYTWILLNPYDSFAESNSIHVIWSIKAIKKFFWLVHKRAGIWRIFSCNENDNSEIHSYCFEISSDEETSLRNFGKRRSLLAHVTFSDDDKDEKNYGNPDGEQDLVFKQHRYEEFSTEIFEVLQEFLRLSRK